MPVAWPSKPCLHAKHALLEAAACAVTSHPDRVWMVCCVGSADSEPGTVTCRQGQCRRSDLIRYAATACNIQSKQASPPVLALMTVTTKPCWLMSSSLASLMKCGRTSLHACSTTPWSEVQSETGAADKMPTGNTAKLHTIDACACMQHMHCMHLNTSDAYVRLHPCTAG